MTPALLSAIRDDLVMVRRHMAADRRESADELLVNLIHQLDDDANPPKAKAK